MVAKPSSELEPVSLALQAAILSLPPLQDGRASMAGKAKGRLGAIGAAYGARLIAGGMSLLLALVLANGVIIGMTSTGSLGVV